MTHEHAGTALQLYSTVKKEGMLELSLADVPIPEPRTHARAVSPLSQRLGHQRR